MICPYCHNNSPYTWRRYWRSLRSRVTCTACGRVFKVSPEWRDLYILITVAVLLVLTPTGLHFIFGLPFYMLLAAVAGFSAFIYFDKVAETRATPRALKNHNTQHDAGWSRRPQSGLRLSLSICVIMKLLAISIMLLSLLGNKCFGVVLSEVDSPQDDLQVLGPCDTNVCRHPELRLLGQKYSDLLYVRFYPLEQADVGAIFGAKLGKKPDDFVKPLFVPRMIMESGLTPIDAPDKRHVDYHAIADIGYLEVHYDCDGESISTCVIYLRADAQFVPLKSTNDIPRREAWDNAKFGKLQNWLDDHMPKVTDLGIVEVSTSHPTRIDLGMGTVCIITTRDIHRDTVPFWLSIDLAKETADKNERQKSMQCKSVDRLDEPVGFTIDGKIYRLIPKLVDALRSKNK